MMLLGISLQKVYHHVPLKELRRRARAKDPLAQVLYRAVAYGVSLRVLLWLLVSISAAAFFVTLSRSFTAWLAFFGCVALIWFGFAWLPSTRATNLTVQLTSWVTPALAWLLRYLHPVVDRLARFIRRHRPVQIHTGLYQKDDLLELISQQRSQTDNRMTKVELELASYALTFGDKLVREYLTPRRVVKTVSLMDSIGPVLLSELHDSGFSRFPVYEEKDDNIVGTLYLHDLVDFNAGGRVRDIMNKKVYYIHEEQSLYDALQVFLKASHHLLIVVNSFEEFVGIITIEDVLEQIIGESIVDEFDKYDDMRAVAAKQAKKDKDERTDIPSKD